MSPIILSLVLSVSICLATLQKQNSPPLDVLNDINSVCLFLQKIQHGFEFAKLCFRVEEYESAIRFVYKIFWCTRE